MRYRLDAQARLRFLDKLAECRLVEYCNVSQHFAINRNRRFLESVHEYAIRQTVLAHRRVDTRDPQAAKVAILIAPVAVLLLTGTHDRFIGNPEYVVATAAKTFCARDDFLMSRARRYTTFNSWHGLSPYA